MNFLKAARKSVENATGAPRARKRLKCARFRELKLDNCSILAFFTGSPGHRVTASVTFRRIVKNIQMKGGGRGKNRSQERATLINYEISRTPLVAHERAGFFSGKDEKIG